MRLPTPNPAQIDSFKDMYEKITGVRLSDRDATETATMTLQLFYLCTYGGNSGRQEPLENEPHKVTGTGRDC